MTPRPEFRCAGCGRALRSVLITETGGPAGRTWEIPQTCPTCKASQRALGALGPDGVDLHPHLKALGHQPEEENNETDC